MLSSPALSSTVIKGISYFLEDHLVPSTSLHGVLLEIYGLGVLLIGESGVGKSESALDLITRGHSLVADDRVTVKRYPNGELVGYSEGPLRHHMELRGIGIINVQDLFGLASVRERTTIDLVDRAGALAGRPGLRPARPGRDRCIHILETPCPYIRMPVAMGRNISILVEIAARNHVLKLQGHHSAREFARKLEAQLERNRKGPARYLGSAAAGHHHRPLGLGQERGRQVLRGPLATTRSTTSRCRCCAQFLDNPLELVGGHDRIAVVTDVRAPGFAEEFPRLFAEIDRERIEPTAALPRSLGRGAGAPLLRDPPAPSAGAGPAGDRGDPARAGDAGRAAGPRRHGVRHQRAGRSTRSAARSTASSPATPARSREWSSPW